MRKFLLPLAAAASMLTVAAPASAQVAPWAPPVYRYQPYNYGYGFNGFRFAQAMSNRVNRIRADIRTMQQRRILTWNDARRLDYAAQELQRRIYRATRGGVSPAEARGIENSIRGLEMNVQREASEWNNRYGRPGYRRY